MIIWKNKYFFLKTIAFHFQSKAFLLSSDKILRYQISFFFLWKLGSHLRKYGGYALNKCHILHLCENDELCLSSTHVVGHSVLENKPWRPNQSLRFFSVSFEFFLNTIEYAIEIYLTVLLGVFVLAASTEGKKIPRFIRKLNKYLGLPPKSNRTMDILLIRKNAVDIQTNSEEIDANFKSINKAEIINFDHYSVSCKTTSKWWYIKVL